VYDAFELISPNALSARRSPSVTSQPDGGAAARSPAMTAGRGPRRPWLSSWSREPGPPLIRTFWLTGDAVTGPAGCWAALTASYTSTAG
jgi:hypothetical protein